MLAEPISTLSYRGVRVSVLIPCYNEEATVATVVTQFRESLPQASVHVFDNASSDATALRARESGARVAHVPLKGKGNVVRRMFADVDADVYVMVDGDATYEAAAVRHMVDKLIDEGLDMVVGCRTEDPSSGDPWRRGHRWGNRMLTESVRLIFGGTFQDMLSGYRAFSRRYVKSFPALARGFETETELTVHALELRMPCGEVATQYGARPEGSASKLSTYRDGWRILKTIGRLFMTERPLMFFGIISLLLATLSVSLAVPIYLEFLATSQVRRFPTLGVATAMMLSAMVSLACGLILDTVTRGRHELKRLVYMSIPRTSGASR